MIDHTLQRSGEPPLAGAAADFHLLTPGGLERIKHELFHLIEVRRAEVTEDIRLARECGDVSESAELAVAKASQEQVETRIAELRSVLARARVLDTAELSLESAGIGAEVSLRELETEEEWSLTLVSPIEADPECDLISVHCPMGEALLGKRVGELAVANTPSGTREFKVTEIRCPTALV